jgi:hypothetical protein
LPWAGYYELVLVFCRSGCRHLCCEDFLVKIAKKYKEFMTKPRQGWVFRTSEYILNDSEALYILFVMAHFFGFFFFGTLLGIMIYYDLDKFIMVIVGIVTLLNARKLYFFWKNRKQSKEMLKGINVKTILGKNNK